MRSIKDDMYDEAFRLWDMVPAGTVPGYGSAGSVYRFANGCGHGIKPLFLDLTKTTIHMKRCWLPSKNPRKKRNPIV